MSQEEKDRASTFKFDFYMPCKFDYHPEKKVIFYTLLYNLSLQENAFLKSYNVPFGKDNNLLALKTTMDNVILELQSRKHNLPFTPEIELKY